MCNELSNKEKQALRSIPIGTNANNNQTVKYNSTTKKFEFTNAGGEGGGGGIGDAVLAGDNNFTGNNFFANNVYIGTDSLGDNSKIVATLGNLRAYASLSANDQIFEGLRTSFTNPIFIGDAYDEFKQLQTKKQVIDAISNKADTSALANYATTASLNNYAAKAAANTFTANQNINANLAVGGTFTATARAHVRGDGTNPIARFENNSGLGSFVVSNSINAVLSGVLNPTYQVVSSNSHNHCLLFGIGNNGTRAEFSMGSALSNFAIINGSGWTGFSMINGVNERNTILIGNNGINGTSGTSRLVIHDSIAEPTGSTNFRTLNIAYTINNSGAQTGNATGIFLNATQTNLNGMSHNLIDLQVNGNSAVRANNSGTIFNPSGGNYNNGQYGSLGKGFITFVNNGVVRLDNASENGFSLLQFGGNSVNQPAIKPNGAVLDFVLANDSGFATIRANGILANSLIRCAASTAGSASIQITAGTAPTSPNEGDIWNSGDGRLYIRIGGVTRYFSLV